MSNIDIEIKINSNCKNPKITIETAEITSEINNLIKKLSESNLQIICGFLDDKVEILNEEDIIYIYCSDSKVFASTIKNDYKLKLRLYELENQLNKSNFIRISNSEIINLKMVKSLHLSFTGTIYVKFINNKSTYVSRRYVKRFKEILGIWGD